jgi:hypothetical protein
MLLNLVPRTVPRCPKFPSELKVRDLTSKELLGTLFPDTSTYATGLATDSGHLIRRALALMDQNIPRGLRMVLQSTFETRLCSQAATKMTSTITIVQPKQGKIQAQIALRTSSGHGGGPETCNLHRAQLQLQVALSMDGFRITMGYVALCCAWAYVFHTLSPLMWVTQ